MFFLVIAVHVTICLLLILIVLVQQGRGGGLIDSFSSAESIFGTKTNTFLVKSTSVLATVFFLTCLSLAFLSLQKGKSLIETTYRPEAKMPTVPVAGTSAPESSAPAQGDASTQPATQTPAETTQKVPTPTDETQESNPVSPGAAKDVTT